MKYSFVVLALLLAGCGKAPESVVDPEIAAAIAGVKAIDNHAHPVRPVGAGEAPDRGFDALPVEGLEASSDPVRFRPGGNHYLTEATQAIFGADKAASTKAWGSNYAATVLDKVGIDRMVANRVSMGPGLPGDRFLWAGYVDALMYPFPTAVLEINSDRKAFFALEAGHLLDYYRESGVAERPASLDEYVGKVIAPTLERHKKGGAIAEKFEMAYLRTLSVGDPSKAEAEAAWRSGAKSAGDYRILQDYLFRVIAKECGRLGMAVHLHTGSGAGGYFDMAGGNPANLEPLLNDPALRRTNFVMLHGGWPYSRQAAGLLTKPNAYIDCSVLGLIVSPSEMADALRAWLEFVPEKVLFGSDAYTFAPGIGWEEAAYASTMAAREALGRALTAMVRDGSITKDRAKELARMVMRDNAMKLYGLK